jgi:hypothetical protein
VDASLGITECVLLGLLFLFVRRAAVVLVNLDVIDKLRIVILPSVSARAIISALLATLFTSFRSRTALQIEILSPDGVLSASDNGGESSYQTLGRFFGPPHRCAAT